MFSQLLLAAPTRWMAGAGPWNVPEESGVRGLPDGRNSAREQSQSLDNSFPFLIPESSPG